MSNISFFIDLCAAEKGANKMHVKEVCEFVVNAGLNGNREITLFNPAANRWRRFALLEWDTEEFIDFLCAYTWPNRQVYFMADEVFMEMPLKDFIRSAPTMDADIRYLAYSRLCLLEETPFGIADAIAHLLSVPPVLELPVQVVTPYGPAWNPYKLAKYVIQAAEERNTALYVANFEQQCGYELLLGNKLCAQTFAELLRYLGLEEPIFGSTPLEIAQQLKSHLELESDSM